MKMKMVDKTEQSESCYCSALPKGSLCLPCYTRGWPCPVIREKSQSRAQNDSLSLSPAHDSTSLYLHFRALGRPLLWAAYFWPQHHAGVNECGSFAAVIFFLFALHRRSTWVLELLS